MYCLITNLNAFLAHANRVKTGQGHSERKYCERCLNSFWSRNLLQKHSELCGTHDPMCIKMPNPASFVRYENLHKELPVPFVVYADLEAVNPAVRGAETNYAASGSRTVEKQLPCSCGMTLLGADGNIVDTYIYHGIDCIQKLLDKLRIWTKACRCLKQMYRVLRMKPKEKHRMLVNAAHCCICGSEFSKDQQSVSDQPVVHHCHVTGKVYGVAHSQCNAKVRTQAFLPVVFHNLSRV